MYEEFLKQIEDFMFIEFQCTAVSAQQITVSQQGDLQEFLTRKNVIVGHTKRNGIF